MASLKSMHVFLPLSISLFLSLHVVAAAHRKLNLNKLPINRVLMSSSSPNAFDAPHNLDSHNNFNRVADKDSSSFNYQDNAINGFTDIADREFNTNSYTNSYGANANLPISTTNTHQANEVHYSNPTAYEFSSPSSSSTPSLYEGKFPRSFEASFPGSRTGYGKQSFSFNDKQGLYNYPSDAKSFFYKYPSRVESSPSKEEQSLYRSPSNYEANYNPFHGGSDINRATQFDELKNNNHVSDSYGFKNEKPVSNYDSFFNSPTIHKNEVEGSTTTSPFERPKFPLSDHDLTYGHVQVP